MLTPQRPNGLTDNSAVTWVQNVVYGAANEMTSMQNWSGGGYTEARVERNLGHPCLVPDAFSIAGTERSVPVQ
jgi:hypothetical protein